MQHTNASKTVRLPTLVETIGLGFGAVNRCLWVLAIPVLLDALYWLGPRLNVQPLVQQLIALSTAMERNALDAEARQFWAELGAQTFPFDLAQLGLPRQTNLFSPKYINLLTPAITPPIPPIVPAVWHVDNLALLLLVQILAVVGSLLVTSVYIAGLADAVRGGGIGAVAQRWARGFASMLGIALVFTAAALLLGVPLVIGVAFIFLVSPTIAQLLVLVALALLFWMLFTASFGFDAVFMSQYGPLRALLVSLYIVQRSFWAAAGLFVLSWLILAGLSLVWQMLAVNVFGLALAVIGSAYISSGLAAAHLVFYRDRLSNLGQRRYLSRS